MLLLSLAFLMFAFIERHSANAPLTLLLFGAGMFWVPDEDHPPFGRIQVDPILCIGCKKCISKGPDGCFLDGCPWDAIVMVDTAEVEKEVGVMAI